MAIEVTTDIITPADSYDLISLADCKTLLGISSSDTTSDAQLAMLIEMNSWDIAVQCNRVFAKETLQEYWECNQPQCCPDGAARIWLSHFPVESIDSVESPPGTVLDPSSYRLDYGSGELKVYAWSGDIVIVYTGGYNLPEESPPPLKKITGLMVRTFKTDAAAAATSGSGIRMLAHRESRIMYFPPKDMVAGGAATTTAAPSAQTQAVKNVLAAYTRYFI